MRKIFLYLTELTDRWACVMTGYRYAIAQEAGPGVMRMIWKYAIGLLLIMMLWFFVGYSFAIRYLMLSGWKAILGGLIATLAIWVIERLIIHTNFRKLFSGIAILRIILGFLTACVGSVILDQYMFRQDIDLAKQKYIELQITQILPDRIHLIDQRIAEANQQRLQIDAQIQEITEEVRKHPTIQMPNYTYSTVKDSSGKVVQRSQVTHLTAQPNPEMNRIGVLYRQRSNIDSLVTILQDQKQHVADQLRQELENNHGLLTEINAFIYFIFHSNGSRPAFWVWVIFLSLFLIIELLILSIKLLDHKQGNLYDEIINYVEEKKRSKLRAIYYPDLLADPS